MQAMVLAKRLKCLFGNGRRPVPALSVLSDPMQFFASTVKRPLQGRRMARKLAQQGL